MFETVNHFAYLFNWFDSGFWKAPSSVGKKLLTMVEEVDVDTTDIPVNNKNHK